jgi:hypothetical protein
MKIDDNSFDIDIAALVQTVCIGFCPYALAYSYTEDA